MPAKKGSIPWNKGKSISEETRQKLIISHIGQIAWNKGLTKDDPRVEKCAKYGRNHHNWKGGITPLIRRIRDCFKYRQWRSDIYTRDDFTCQKCNRRGGYLHAHHKQSFSDILEINDIKTFKQAMECSELWNINNGITYCEKCHNELHIAANLWARKELE